MNKAVFVDLDSLRCVHPNPLHSAGLDYFHQEIIDGVLKALAYHQRYGYRLFGIDNLSDYHSNQQSAISHYKIILSLLPQLTAIYVSADTDGLICWRITIDSFSEVNNHSRVQELTVHEEFKFRIPGSGILRLASLDFGINLEESWVISSKQEWEQAATNAKVRFIEDDIWHNRFRPGVYQLRNVNLDKLQFLENFRMPNYNN